MMNNEERITFEIDRKTKRELKAYADKMGTSVSFILRSWIKDKKLGEREFKNSLKRFKN